MPEKILFVDDEVQVLEGFQRLLHNTFQIETAAGAAEALKKLRKSKEYAVVVCDMRMPDMDGVHLLQKLKVDFPDVVRIMLTGNSDQQTAVEAVNEGNIFRFLNKPCGKDALVKALSAALIHYKIANNKEDLLDKARYGHRLEPWTADPTSAAYLEVEQQVRELVGDAARTVQPSGGGIYLGKIISVSSDYVVQSLSPARVIVHPKNLLTTVPQPGEYVRIEYSSSQGEVEEIPHRRP
jgi:DNA-binding NtrC family response regulator